MKTLRALLASLAIAGFSVVAASQVPVRPSPQVQAVLTKSFDAWTRRDSAESLRLAEEALALARSRSDRSGEATATFRIAVAQGGLGLDEKALESHRKALVLVKEVGNRSVEAGIHLASGDIYIKMSKPTEALSEFRQALAIQTSLGNKQASAITLERIGDTLLNLDRPQEAVSSFEQELSIAKEIKNRSRQAYALHFLGTAYANLTQYTTSLSYLEQASSIFTELKDRRGEAQVLVRTGIVHGGLGRPHKAIDYLQKSLEISEKLGDKRPIAFVHNQLGAVYSGINQYQLALQHLDRALSIYREIGVQRGEALASVGIGLLYAKVGRPQKSIDVLERSLPILRELSLKNAEADALMNLGTSNSTLGRYQVALDWFMRGRMLHEEVGNLRGQTLSASGIGQVLSNLGRYKEALTHFEKALVLARQCGDRRAEAFTQLNIGNVLAHDRNFELALDRYEASLQLYQEVGERRQQAAVLASSGFAYSQLGKREHALERFRRAVDLFESVRADLGSDTESKSVLLSSSVSIYYQYLQLLLQLDKTEEAFAIAQKTKAQMLLDLLAAGRVDLNASLTPEEAKQERSLREQAYALNSAMVQEGVQNEDGSKKRYEAAKKQLKEVEDNLQTLTLTLYARSLAGRTVYSTVQDHGVAMRILSMPIERRGSVDEVLQLAYPLEGVQRQIDALTSRLFALVPFALLAAGLGGAFLTGRALRPVREIAGTAARLGAKDLSERLPLSGNDEFSDLSSSINAMLARLEEAFERQRRFTADASHELRTPLSIVKANTGLALEHPWPEERYREFLTAIDIAAGRQSRIVEELLFLARADAGRLARDVGPVCLIEALEEAVGSVSRADRAHIRLQSIDPALMVQGSGSELTRLFTNLLENAVRHTPPEGTVTVSATADATSATIAVADTGEGIAPEHLPHLGERFYRVDAARTTETGGTGLGLAICRSIVEAHSGRMTIESKVGEGTTVQIRLALYPTRK